MTAAPAAERFAADRLALIARTLQIPPATWRAFVAAYERDLPPAPPAETADDELARCLPALAAAYRALSPHAAPLPQGAPARICPACAQPALHAAVARRAFQAAPSLDCEPPPMDSGGQSPRASHAPRPAASLVYGRCARCGHGELADADDQTIAATYQDGRYYSARDARGVGYDDYGDEAAYREAKGARLIARIESGSTPPAPALLEIGSGFGFTRAAARRAGWFTAGVDVSGHAVAEAGRRYGFETFQGTLADALASSPGAIGRGSFGVALYQFVLEHVADPVGELSLAREALMSGGWLALLVPSMEAAEVDVFGASYRSFRADHLHLFSRASLGALLGRAGFVLRALDSHCNIHLLEGLLSAGALARLYDGGRGPDLLVLAERQR